MHRITYEMARRLIRDNGNYALVWMAPKVREEMTRLAGMKKRTDWLAERMHITEWAKANGFKVTPAQTGPLNP